MPLALIDWKRLLQQEQTVSSPNLCIVALLRDSLALLCAKLHLRFAVSSAGRAHLLNNRKLRYFPSFTSTVARSDHERVVSHRTTTCALLTLRCGQHLRFAASATGGAKLRCTRNHQGERTSSWGAVKEKDHPQGVVLQRPKFTAQVPQAVPPRHCRRAARCPRLPCSVPRTGRSGSLYPPLAALTC